MRTTAARHRPRIALYSHDTMGLGHVRRNMRIAKVLAGPPTNADVLLITGENLTAAYDLPIGIDSVTLPAVCKDADGRYHAKSLRSSLADVIALRSAMISAALREFTPDLFIADNVPRGVAGELDASLILLRSQDATCVLGLRDILDLPEVVKAEWRARDNVATIRRYYDAVWIYGDANVYDARSRYGFTRDICNKVTFTGYISDHTANSSIAQRFLRHLQAVASQKRYVLCMVGGGQDGADVARAFARARFPTDLRGILITGPFMPTTVMDELAVLSASSADFELIDFVNSPEMYLRGAERVITMGGYNTVIESLGLKRPTLIVPRTEPRAEQLVRAERFAELGLADVLSPDDLNPQTLSAWMAAPLPENAHRANQIIDMYGLSRIRTLTEILLSDARQMGSKAPISAGAGI